MNREAFRPGRRRLLATAAMAMVAAPLFARAAAAAAEPELSLETLRARYTLPTSRFVTLGGLPVHYTDQGRGPVIVLLHSSYLDLTAWDAWVAEFARDHRVIRLDRLRYGLTGVYTGEPVDYPQEQKMLDAVVAHLKLGRFTLVGTSSGGIVAAQYADRHPEKVERLILANFPLGAGRITSTRPVPAPGAPPPVRSAAERIGTILDKNVVDRRVLTPQVVRRLVDLDNREDPDGKIRGAFVVGASYAEGDRAAMLQRLKMPTLVLWSAENRTVAVADGEAAFRAIGATDKAWVVIPDAGHMLPLEKGADSAAVARKFLEGARVGAPPKA